MPLQQRLQRAGLVVDGGPGVAPLGQAGGNGGDGQLVGGHVGHLGPADGGGHLGAGPGPHRPSPEHRLVGRVLVEVDEHPLAPLLLPPGVGDEVGAAAGQLPGQGHGRGPHLVGVPAGQQPDVDVQAAAAGGLGEAPQPELVEGGPHLAGRLPDLVEDDAGLGVEVDAQLVGVIGVRGPAGPDVEAQAPGVGGPHHMGDVGGHHGVGGGAVGGAHHLGAQPVGGALGHPLLEKRRPLGPVGVALQQGGAVAHGPHEGLGHGQVVADQIELGLAPLGEEHLVGVGDPHLAPGQLEDHRLSGHGGGGCRRSGPVTAGRPRRSRRRQWPPVGAGHSREASTVMLGGNGPGQAPVDAGHGSALERAVLKMADEGVDGEAVAGRPEPGDHPQADRGQHRGAAEVLPGVNVGEVGLHHRDVDGGDGVAQGDGVVGEGAGVEDDPVGRAPGPVQGIDQLALDVGLEVLDNGAALGSVSGEVADDLVERGRPVHLGLPLPQQVQVGPVHHQQRPSHGLRCITAGPRCGPSPGLTTAPSVCNVTSRWIWSNHRPRPRRPRSMTTGELASLIIAITASLTLVWTVSWAISSRLWKQSREHLDTKFKVVDTKFEGITELIHATNKATNQRIDATNQRIDDTNKRIDDTNTIVAQLRDDLQQTLHSLIPASSTES